MTSCCQLHLEDPLRLERAHQRFRLRDEWNHQQVLRQERKILQSNYQKHDDGRLLAEGRDP